MGSWFSYSYVVLIQLQMTIAGLNIDLPDGLGAASSDLFVHSTLSVLADLRVKCISQYHLKNRGHFEIIFFFLFREFEA